MFRNKADEERQNVIYLSYCDEVGSKKYTFNTRYSKQLSVKYQRKDLQIKINVVIYHFGAIAFLLKNKTGNEFLRDRKWQN